MSSTFLIMNEWLPVNQIVPSTEVVAAASTFEKANDKLREIAFLHEIFLASDADNFVIEGPDNKNSGLIYEEYRIDEWELDL